MKPISISFAKNHLSALLERVRRGETVVILDRNRPVARLAPVERPTGSAEDARWLAGLARDGLLAPATEPLPAADLPAPVAPREDVSIVDALIADRDDA
jgi:prevent-host-death family protein